MRIHYFLTEEEIDELTRRGFLKGLGATAAGTVPGVSNAQIRFAPGDPRNQMYNHLANEPPKSDNNPPIDKDKIPPLQSKQLSGDTLWGNIKSGTPINLLKKHNNVEDCGWRCGNQAQLLNIALGIPKSQFQGVTDLPGPYGGKNRVIILGDKQNLVIGTAIIVDMKDLPPEWIEGSGGIGGFNRGEFLQFIKKVVNNIPTLAGTKVGKLSVRSDGGIGLNAGVGIAAPVGKSGAVGAGIGLDKLGSIILTQKLSKDNLDATMIIHAGTQTGILGQAIRPGPIIFLYQDQSVAEPDLDTELFKEDCIMSIKRLSGLAK